MSRSARQRRRFWWLEKRMLIGCVRQKGICELWRAVALHRGTIQEPHASKDRLRLSLHEEMSSLEKCAWKSVVI